jgi:uncharacterized protein involved in type VI secretion and phage assembly
MSDEILHDLVDQLRSRFYGKYRGIVTDVEPEHMRVKATVPAVLADAEVWCMPCVPFAGPSAGFCFLPQAGTGVWVEFEGGDPSLGIWTGAFWVDEVPSDVAAKVAVIATPGGHKLVFDDDAGEIRIEDSNGASIVFDSSGVTTKRDSSSVAVSSSSVSVNDGALEVK